MLRIAQLAPWRRAPALVLRTPLVMVAVVISTAILALASGSAALFLSSAASKATQLTMVQPCPTSSYPQITGKRDYEAAPVNLATFPGNFNELVPKYGGDRWSSADEITDLTAAMRAEGLPTPQLLLQSGGQLAGGVTDATPRVSVIYKQDAISHIEITSGTAKGGVLVPDDIAAKMGLVAGQSVLISGKPIHIALIYRSLAHASVSGFWCEDRGLFYNEPGSSKAPSPMLLATSAETVLALDATATFRLSSPVDVSHASLSAARRWQSQIHKAIAAVPSSSHPINGIKPDGDLQNTITDVTLLRSGPVVPVAIGGSLVALFLVAATASYWVDRRRVEVRLLASRGVSGRAIALKACLEVGFAALVGTFLGAFGARWLIAELGPSEVYDPSALPLALLSAAVGLIAGLAAIAVVAARRANRLVESATGAARGRWVKVPFEVLLLVGSGLMWWLLRTNGAVALDRNIPVLSPFVLVFPLLFLLGSAILVVRITAAGLPRLRRSGRNLPNAGFLAVARITAARVTSTVVLAALILPIGMTLYAAGLTDSSRVTLNAKAGVFVGSSTSFASTVGIDPATPAAKRGALVHRYGYVTVDGAPAELVVVDPATFAKYAYWNDSFAGMSIKQAAALLARPAVGGRLPVLVTGVSSASQIILGDDKTSHPLQVMAYANALPGRHLAEPYVLVSQQNLPDVPQSAGRTDELWTTQNPGTVATELRDANVFIFSTLSMTQELYLANLLSISWSFDYLQALAELTGLIAIGGLILYVETRARTRMASYALARRMGITRRTHARSLLIEFAALAVIAAAAGALLAWAAARIINPMLELDPTRLPPPIFTTPTSTLITVGIGAALTAIIVAAYAQRAVDRVRPAEVLKLAN